MSAREQNCFWLGLFAGVTMAGFIAYTVIAWA